MVEILFAMQTCLRASLPRIIYPHKGWLLVYTGTMQNKDNSYVLVCGSFHFRTENSKKMAKVNFHGFKFHCMNKKYYIISNL